MLWQRAEVRSAGGEISEIRRLLREKTRADRAGQKAIRQRLRSIGFRISEFASTPGFGETDLDELIRLGTITIVDHEALLPAPGSEVATGASVDVSRKERADARGPVELAHWIEEALNALAERIRLSSCQTMVPDRPGLYAIHGNRGVWDELGLDGPPDDRPLYVGKAEDSLVRRDLKTHFGNGRTGSSTVRRSFAALLQSSLVLEARPRNPRQPERFANYGLSAEDDARLTIWMRQRLELAVWPKPGECAFSLLQIERGVLESVHPPLNLRDVITPWAPRVKAARAAMADSARRWQASDANEHGPRMQQGRSERASEDHSP